MYWRYDVDNYEDSMRILWGFYENCLWIFKSLPSACRLRIIVRWRGNNQNAHFIGIFYVEPLFFVEIYIFLVFFRNYSVIITASVISSWMPLIKANGHRIRNSLMMRATASRIIQPTVFQYILLLIQLESACFKKVRHRGYSLRQHHCYCA